MQDTNNLPENFIKSIQEYNKRLIKLNNDLFIITQSEKFKTFSEFIQHDLDLGKFSMYVFNHVENNDLDFENRIMANDFSVFSDKSMFLLNIYLNGKSFELNT